MASKRMFSLDIIDSDAFVSMPSSSQSLYFHLSMRADDDGFVKNPKRIQRDVGSSDDDMKVLIAKRFILPFDSGVVVIKHWRINNNIRSDRYKPTTFLEEKSTLAIKENGAYTEAYKLGIPSDNQVTTTRLSQYSIGLGKSSFSIDSDKYSNRTGEDSGVVDEPPHHDDDLSQFYGNVYLSENQIEDLIDKLGIQVFDTYVEKLDAFITKNNATNIKSHHNEILKWATEDGLYEQLESI